MAIVYLQCDSPFLRQGEIIGKLSEFKLQIPAGNSFDVNAGIKFDLVEHPYAIVVSQDCDLKWDYEARNGTVADDKLLTHVLFCALFTQYEIKSRSRLTTEPMKRVRQNQDERYHHLDEAPINGSETKVPELIADFKTTFSLPTEFVYWMMSTKQATRNGFLPPQYLEDFMHRLYSFLGRVAIP